MSPKGASPNSRAVVCSVALAATALLALSSCGSGQGGSEEEGAPPRPAPMRVRIEVRPAGPGGPASTRTVACEVATAQSRACRLLRGVEVEDFARVGGRRACTQIFGGPATARVSGSLRGRPIDARFSLVDGCEIERWRRLSPLLGAPPTRGGPRPPY